MSSVSEQNLKHKKDFDYFHTIIKSWKFIFIFCLVITSLTWIVLKFVPQPNHVKTIFLVSLNPKKTTPFGEYYLKSSNPEHYLSILKSEEFKQNVLESIDLEDRKIDFELNVERNDISQEKNKYIYPNKFELVVSGENTDELIQVNEYAFMTLNQMMNTRIVNDMVFKFENELTINIDSLKFAIASKKELLNSLDSLLLTVSDHGGIGQNNLDNLIDSRLLSSLEKGKQGVLISMLLNEGKGSEYYISSILAIEQIALNKLTNELNDKNRLLLKLREKVKNEEQASLFEKPFSSNVLILSAAHSFLPENSNGSTKIILMFTLVALIISVSIVLLRKYNFNKSSR